MVIGKRSEKQIRMLKVFIKYDPAICHPDAKDFNEALPSIVLTKDASCYLRHRQLPRRAIMVDPYKSIVGSIVQKADDT